MKAHIHFHFHYHFHFLHIILQDEICAIKITDSVSTTKISSKSWHLYDHKINPRVLDNLKIGLAELIHKHLLLAKFPRNSGGVTYARVCGHNK